MPAASERPKPHAPPPAFEDQDPFAEISPLPGYPDDEELAAPESPCAAPPAPAAVSVNMAEAPGAEAQVAAIKSLIFSQSRMVSSCLNAVLSWRFENGEVKLAFARKDAGVADIVKGREPASKLRAACEQVLGRPVKICVTLQEKEGETTPRPRVQDRAANDPAVEAFRKRFDCTWIDFEDLSQE